MTTWTQEAEERHGFGAYVTIVGIVAACVGGLGASVMANGVTQREIQGRIVSVDAAAGTIVVASEFRGKTTRVTLKVAPRARIFDCATEQASLDRVRQGMSVSAFYEVVGADGVVNLIVLEPAR